LEIYKAVWALGNVAGDSPKCRDLVLANGALMPLLSQLNEHALMPLLGQLNEHALMPLLGQLNEHAKLSMLRNSTWTFSNFCRGKPQPAFEQVCVRSCSFIQLFFLCW
jgi:hypothetical protein